MITESVSEKPKRGRPRSWVSEAWPTYAALFPDIKSAHGQANVIYRQLALNVLLKLWERGDTSLGWLANPDDMTAGGNKWRPSILVELGRLMDAYSEDDMLLVARELTPNITTKQAVAHVRARRLHGSPVADCLELTGRLCNVLDGYMGSHDGVTEQMVLTAIDNLRGLFLETQASELAT